MANARLTERYRQALLYYRAPESEAARLMNADAGEYEFCRGFVSWSYSDRSKWWDDDQHMEAFEAARKGAGDVRKMDVSEV